MLAGMQRCVLGIQDPDESRTTTLPWGRTKRRIVLSGRCKKTSLGSIFHLTLANPLEENICISLLAISKSLQMLWLKMQ